MFPALRSGLIAPFVILPRKPAQSAGSPMISPPVRKYRLPPRSPTFVGQCVNEAFSRRASRRSNATIEDIVGRNLPPLRADAPAIAAARRPRPGRHAHRVEGAYAIELQYLAPIVMERVNRYFGWRCVGRIAIRQGPVTPRAAPPVVHEPEAAAIEEITREIGPFEDASLGQSIASLGALVRGRVTRA